jgi:hypothetical protein
MKPSRLILVLICLCALGGALVAYRGQRSAARRAVPVVPEVAASMAAKPGVPAEAPATSVVAGTAEQHAPAAPVPATPPAPASMEQSIQRIETAVVTYEAGSLPVIAPYLTHSDPELRLAAREGMLQMGLSEAVPFLREAAGKMKDPREAILLLDAADFLELPSMSDLGGKKRVAHQPPTTTRPSESSARQ